MLSLAFISIAEDLFQLIEVTPSPVPLFDNEKAVPKSLLVRKLQSKQFFQELQQRLLRIRSASLPDAIRHSLEPFLTMAQAFCEMNVKYFELKELKKLNAKTSNSNKKNKAAKNENNSNTPATTSTSATTTTTTTTPSNGNNKQKEELLQKEFQQAQSLLDTLLALSPPPSSQPNSNNNNNNTNTNTTITTPK